MEDVLFTVKTPLGVTIRTTKAYWESILSTKHPSLQTIAVEKFITCLQGPDQIRRSKHDPLVYLYYKKLAKHFVCMVAKHTSAIQGYIITAYLTDIIKEGERVYDKD